MPDLPASSRGTTPPSSPYLAPLAATAVVLVLMIALGVFVFVLGVLATIVIVASLSVVVFAVCVLAGLEPGTAGAYLKLSMRRLFGKQ